MKIMVRFFHMQNRDKSPKRLLNNIDVVFVKIIDLTIMSEKDDKDTCEKKKL